MHSFYSPAVFNPKILSGLYAWYRSDSLILSGASPTQTVSAALDKSGNGRDAVQATSANQPNYSASGGANNKPYWSNTTGGLPAGKHLLAGVASDWTFLHNGSGFTIFVVQKNTVTNNYYILGTQNGSGANRGFGLARLSDTSARFAIGDGSTQQVVSDFTMPQTTWSKLAISGSTGGDPDYSIRVNGSNTSTANEAGALSATVSPYPLGIGVGGGVYYSTDASFHEIIIYNRELVNAEVILIENYLKLQYNL